MIRNIKSIVEELHLTIVRTSSTVTKRIPRGYTLDNTAWNGTDANGNAVADGLYDYVIPFYPMVPGLRSNQRPSGSG